MTSVNARDLIAADTEHAAAAPTTQAWPGDDEQPTPTATKHTRHSTATAPTAA